MMERVVILISENLFIETILLAIVLDSVLGMLRAIKERKFNSSVGIDGAIRKVAMITSVGLLMAVDEIMNINAINLLPKTFIKYAQDAKVRIGEMFCLMFILYETISILKNMTLCGLPIPLVIKTCVQKFLDEMTGEIEDKIE